MKAYTPGSIWEPELTARPCRAGVCTLPHTHDPLPLARYEDSEFGAGVDVTIPIGGTAQNNYRPVFDDFSEDEHILYQCNFCGSILEGHELDGHTCPETMEDNRE